MKKIISYLAAAAMTASMIPQAIAANDDITVMINNEKLVIKEGDTKPFVENDRTLVPMRAIFEKLGASVEWDDATKTVTSYDTDQNITIIMQVGSDTYTVNGEELKLDVPAQIVNGRTVVPLRAVAEGLNATVNWDGETRTIYITSAQTDISDYDSFAELNAAMGYKGVHELSNPMYKINTYSYIDYTDSAGMLGEWQVGAGGTVLIGFIKDDGKEASVRDGFKAEEEYKTKSGTNVKLFRNAEHENLMYAAFSLKGFKYHAELLAEDWDPKDALKTLVDDIEAAYVSDNADAAAEETSPDGIHSSIQHETASPEWVTKLPSAQDKNTKQLFVVAGLGMDKTTATISMHERDKDGNWKQILSTPGYVGKNGLCTDEDHKEGCGQTPTGVFRFNKAFGIAADPGCTAFDYVKVTNDTYWSGDDKEGMHYNEMVDIKDFPNLDMENSEHIVDYEYQYQYCLNISFNEDGTPGRGSAIFLHCLGPIKPYTGGCVALPENIMKMIMQRVQTDCVVVIDTLDNLGGTL